MLGGGFFQYYLEIIAFGGRKQKRPLTQIFSGKWASS
jgi:hypothetical protein